MKVLVIEDSDDVRISIEQILVEAGYIVDSARDGEEGLYRALNWEYSAILLDIMLPEKSGWEVLAEIKKTSSTPVIILSAMGELDDRVRGLRGGADDYIIKPFEPAELLARVHVVIRRLFEKNTNVIQLGRVRIDLLAKEVKLDDVTVALTATEYRILTYLAQRAGQFISPAEITDAIHDDSYDTDSNVLKVQIYHLRKKLGKDLIENRRNMGYIINGSQG